MNRVEEIIDIIFSLPEEERKEVERGIRERKRKMRDLKLKTSGVPWADLIYHGRGYRDLPSLKRELAKIERSREK